VVEQLPGGSAPGHGDGDLAAAPARFAARIAFLKEEVFDICAALALGESLLIRLGMLPEAAHLAEVFSVVEGRLAAPQASAEAAGSESLS
jgi:hypothetical protein